MVWKANAKILFQVFSTPLSIGIVFVSTLKQVPKLVPKEECSDVPKEICSRTRVNPQKRKRPVIKKWCYVPTKESGLI